MTQITVYDPLAPYVDSLQPKVLRVVADYLERQLIETQKRTNRELDAIVANGNQYIFFGSDTDASEIIYDDGDYIVTRNIHGYLQVHQITVREQGGAPQRVLHLFSFKP